MRVIALSTTVPGRHPLCDIKRTQSPPLHAPRFEVNRGRSAEINRKKILARVGCDRSAIAFGLSQLHAHCPRFRFRRNRHSCSAGYVGLFRDLGTSPKRSRCAAPRMVTSGGQRRSSSGHPCSWGAVSEVYTTLQLGWRCSALHCETLFLRRSNTRSSAGWRFPATGFQPWRDAVVVAGLCV